MRTCVCVPRGHHPARGPRLVLRVGRAARRPAAARQAGDRGRRRGSRGQLRGQGLRRAHGHGRAAGASAVPAGDRRPAADGGLLGGEQGGVRDLRGHDAAGGGHLDRRGVSRRAGHAADRGHAARDGGAAAAAGARGGRAADHGRDCADQVPGQGGERRGEARRAAGGAARWRACVAAPAAGRAIMGRRPGHLREAARPRDRHRRPGGWDLRGGARVAGRSRGGPAAARARAQPGPAARPARPAPALDGLAARARPSAAHVRGARRDAGRRSPIA